MMSLLFAQFDLRSSPLTLLAHSFSIIWYGVSLICFLPRLFWHLNMESTRKSPRGGREWLEAGSQGFCVCVTGRDTVHTCNQPTHSFTPQQWLPGEREELEYFKKSGNLCKQLFFHKLSFALVFLLCAGLAWLFFQFCSNSYPILIVCMSFLLYVLKWLCFFYYLLLS